MTNPEKQLIGVSRLCVIGLPTLFLLVASACEPQKETPTKMPARDINEVMNSQGGVLMAIPGVVGVAVGELDDGTACIQVLVVEETAEISRQVPKELEGHPVKIFVSGEIKPMQGK